MMRTGFFILPLAAGVLAAQTPGGADTTRGATMPVLRVAIPLAGTLVAVTNATIITATHGTIEKGTIIIRNGKITAIGKDLDVPAGALVVDAKGGTVLPALVAAQFRIAPPRPQPSGLPQGMRGRRGGGPQMPPMQDFGAPENKAARKIVQSLYAKQDVFAELLQQGVATLALAPSGPGFPGLGALLDPAGTTLETMTLADAAFLALVPQNNTRSKDLTKGEFEKAKKMLDERKAAATSRPGGAGSQPSASQPGSPPAAGQNQTQPAQVDKNVEVLAELLDGKHKAFVELDSATDVLHFTDALGETRFPMVIVAGRGSNTEGRLDLAIEKLKSWNAPILMQPTLTTVALTRDLVNVPARLHEAGLEVGFMIGNTRDEVRQIFFKLAELVRTGLPAQTALAGVTAVPAKMLGIESRVGTLKSGKNADFMLWSGDPLDPTSRLVSVWHNGKLVEKENKQ